MYNNSFDSDTHLVCMELLEYSISCSFGLHVVV